MLWVLMRRADLLVAKVIAHFVAHGYGDNEHQIGVRGAHGFPEACPQRNAMKVLIAKLMIAAVKAARQAARTISKAASTCG